jgi:hypothetical protein
MAKKTRAAHRVRQIEEAFARRIAIYIRRSTDEDNQPYSLEAQEPTASLRRVPARRLANRQDLLR